MAALDADLEPDGILAALTRAREACMKTPPPPQPPVLTRAAKERLLDWRDKRTVELIEDEGMRANKAFEQADREAYAKACGYWFLT